MKIRSSLSSHRFVVVNKRMKMKITWTNKCKKLMQHLLIALMTIALEIRMGTPVLIGIFLDLRLVETMILMSSLLPICAASACGKTKLPRQLNSKQTSNTLLTSLLRTLLLSSPWTTVITAIILRTT